MSSDLIFDHATQLDDFLLATIAIFFVKKIFSAIMLVVFKFALFVSEFLLK